MKNKLYVRPPVSDLRFQFARETPDPNSGSAKQVDGAKGYVSADGGVIEVVFHEVWEVWLMLI